MKQSLPELLTLNEAMLALKCGEKVRCLVWDEGRFIELLDGRLVSNTGKLFSHDFTSDTVTHWEEREWHVLTSKPLTFPDPPEGREWHNPENLTAAQVEVSKGWRCLLNGERPARDAELHSVRYGQAVWIARSSNFFSKWTYRTRAPLPAPAPARVPLTAADYYAGGPWWMRLKRLDSTPIEQQLSAGMVTGLTSNGRIITAKDKEYFHRDAMLECERSNDGANWQPCSKPAE